MNLAYYRDRTGEWVSIRGRASVVRDRTAMRDLYRPDWRDWFGKLDEQRDSGPDDPR